MLKYEKKLIILLYLIFFVCGCIIIKDYGIGIEENFQRISGFYWLNYIFKLANFSNLQTITDLKINELYNNNPNLPNIANNLAYGIIFDVPAALIEILFNFKHNYNNVYLKHFLSFLIFFISSICFTALLDKRFSNYIIKIFGTTAYFLSPKIFGASFFDGKDIFFLSIFTITIYCYFNFEKKNNISNLLIFALFASFSTSSRLAGLMIPISFLLIFFFKILSQNTSKRYLKTIYIFTISYIFLLFLQWPYLWELNINYKDAFGYSKIKVLFDNQFFYQDILPYSYIPKWIFISTPTFIFFPALTGLTLTFYRVYKRIISIKNNFEKIYKFDFWRSVNENLDFFVLICFVQAVFVYLIFDEQINSSWRHFYFVHFFLSYFFCLFLYRLNLLIKYLKRYLILILVILIILNISLVHKLYLYHPYQNIYFNNLLSENDKLSYERDTSHLSRLEAMKDIINLSKKSKTKIKLGTASWSPLGDVLIMFNKEELKNIELIGNDNLKEADYIFTNYIYEIDINYNNKYEIPHNFKIYKTVKKDKTLIYSIYKRI